MINRSHQKEEHEAEVIRRFMDGDVDAIEEVIAIYHPQLFSYLCKTVSQEDAEEIASTTLYNAWRKIDQFKADKGSFRTWIFAIAKNARVDFLRKHGRYQLSQLCEELDAVVCSDDENCLSPQTALQIRLLTQAIEKLSPQQSQIIKADLACGGKASSKDLAERLGTTTNTIQVSRNRAMKRLRIEMEDAKHSMAKVVNK